MGEAGESPEKDQNLKIILGLDQLQYLSEVTKSLNTLELPKTSGLNLRIAVSEETTDRVVGVWYNVEDREWQLQILS